MPRATASLKPTAQRWPVTLSPRSCATLIGGLELVAAQRRVGLEGGRTLVRPGRDLTGGPLRDPMHPHAALRYGDDT